MISSDPDRPAATEPEAPIDEAQAELAEHIAFRLGDTIIAMDHDLDTLTLRVGRDDVRDVARFLRADGRCVFTILIDLCAVDYPQRAERFEVVYHFLSCPHNQRLRMVTTTTEDLPVPSLCSVFPVADWYEREAFDLYGVLFADHPDLRRILTDYGFRGHPLRKDFPLTGRVEVRYDAILERVVREPVRLPQEFRELDFASPWEGDFAAARSHEGLGEDAVAATPPKPEHPKD